MDKLLCFLMHFVNDVENDDDEIISPKSGFALNTKNFKWLKDT